MTTFLERKLAAFEAALKARKRARWVAIAGIALLTTAATTGQPWLLPLGLVTLVAAVGLAWRARSLLSDGGASDEPAEAPAAVEEADIAPPHEVPDPVGPIVRQAVECALSLAHPVTLDTGDGASVDLPAGRAAAAFRLSYAPQRPAAADAIDYPRCELRIRDPEGAWWRCVTFLDPDFLTRPLEAADREILFWEDAPAAWRAAFDRRCLLAGVRHLMDSRDRIELPVGERSITMMFKYQGPVVDLAWLDAEERVVVRAAKMHYEVWEPGESRDIVDGVTFTFLLEPSEFLPLAEPAAHWRDWAAWEDDDGSARPEPIFRPLAATPE